MFILVLGIDLSHLHRSSLWVFNQIELISELRNYNGPFISIFLKVSIGLRVALHFSNVTLEYAGQHRLRTAIED